MKRLPGVLLFLILALVILHIVTLRWISRDERRIDALEKKVETLSKTLPAAPAAPAPAGQP